MNTKKIIVLVLAMAMMLTIIGCAGTTATVPPQVQPPVVEDNYQEEPDYEEEDNNPGGYEPREWTDGNLRLNIFYNDIYNTHENIIGLTAVVTNIGDETVVFQIGSGSNRVPDALQVEIGSLTPLFRPAIMTMDLQHGQLEPGESITFELPFAPYMPAVEQEFPPLVGFDADLDFFQNEEWVRVPVGEYIGNISFSYVIRGEDDFMMITEEDEIHTIGGDFQLILLAEAAWPEMSTTDAYQEESEEE